MTHKVNNSQYPSRHSAGLNRTITDVAVGRMYYYGFRSTAVMLSLLSSVNRSWRRRRFVTTTNADALMSHTGKAAERSAGRTGVARAGKAAEQLVERSVSRPST